MKQSQSWPGTARAALAALVLGGAPLLALAQPGAAAEPQALPAPAAAAQPTFRLNDVRLAGAQTLPADELRELAQPYIGREVSLADLEALARRITERYRDRGYFLAQALVPVQTVQGGVVEISVIEGRLGKIEVQVAPDAPISEQRVRAFLSPLVLGQAVNAPTYERVMLLLSDQPGIRVSSGLQQGATPGTVDLAVEVAAGKRWSFVAEGDNHGTLEVGRYRLGGTARWSGPAGIGDNLDARLMASDKSLFFGRVSYELPIGASGLRAGLGLSRVQYQLGGAFEPLDARGTADVIDLSLSYPVIRQRNHSLFLRLSLESKALKDEFRAVDYALRKRVDAVGLGWAWERRDALLGGGYFASSGTFYSGRLRIRDADVRAIDQAPGGLHTSGGFSKLVARVSRLQAIVPGHSLYYAAGGQWASKNLDASEKLALGGARAVRAYPSSEALVDQGWVQSLEWRWAATDALTPFLFYDAARGRQIKSGGGAAGNSVSLRGYGIGLAWGRPGDFAVNATLAWRAGTRRALTDGGGRHPRFFIQAQKVF